MSGDEALVQEIFFLAFHLHWSREAILKLPVPERHRYVELLAEQLQQEADKIKGAARP